MPDLFYIIQRGEVTSKIVVIPDLNKDYLTEDVHDLIFFVLSRPNATLLMSFAAWENGRFLLRRFIHFLYMKVESDSVFFTDQGWFLCLF